MAVRVAKKGDTVVKITCRCKGAVICATWKAADWRCERCGQRGKRSAPFTLGLGGAVPSREDQPEVQG